MNNNKIITNAIESQLMKLKIDVKEKKRNNSDEGSILTAHENIYTPLSPIKNILIFPNQAKIEAQRKRRNMIRTMSMLLNIRAKESLLQKELYNFLWDVELEESGKDKIHMEYSIKFSNSRKGRIDILVVNSKIWELKRGINKLIAYSGYSSMRLSSGLKRTIKQINGYKEKIDNSLKDENSSIRLLIVAGRELSQKNEYRLISDIEKSHKSLKIYTWDGLLAELTRIYT